ncbi:MAG: WD40 repeat domain-containing protein [Hellea sp.]
MRRLSQVSENTCSNNYLRKLEGYAHGVAGVTLLSDGRLFTRGSDRKYRLSDQHGENAVILDLQADTLQGRELADGRLMCWTKKRIILIAPDGKILKHIKPNDTFQDVFVLSTGNFFPVVGLKKEPTLYSKEGDPLCRLSRDGSYTDVCGATELPNGRFVTWIDCWAHHVIWNADGSFYDDLRGHSLELYSLETISNDRILSVGADGRSLVYDSDGEEVLELKSPVRIVDVTELRDGRFRVQNEDDEDGVNDLIYYSPKGEYLKTIEAIDFNSAPILELRNDRYLSLSNGWAKSAVIWEGDCEVVAKLEGHTHRIGGALALKDGRIITWSEDNTIRLWTEGGGPLGVLHGHTGKIFQVFELENGELLSSSADGQLLTWDTQKAAPPREAHSKDISGLLQLDDGSVVTWSNTEGVIRIWDKEGQHLQSKKAGDTHTMRGVMKLDDGRYISWGSGQHNLIFDHEFEYSHKIDGYNGEGYSKFTETIAQLSNGWLAMSARSNFHITDLENKSEGAFKAFRYTPLGMQALYDGRILSFGDGIFFIHEASGERIAKVAYEAVPKVLKDGRILVCLDSLKYYNTEGKMTDEVPIEERSRFIRELEGQRLLTTHKEKINIYNLRGELLNTHLRLSESAMGSALLQNGNMLTYGAGPELVLRDTNGALLARLFEHTEAILGVISNDDGLIISWSRDHSFVIWSHDGKALAKHTFDNPIQQALALTGTNDIAVAVGNELYIFRYETEAVIPAENLSKRPGFLKRIILPGL